MKGLPQHLETTIETELEAIRQSVRRLAAPSEASTVGDDFQPIVQAEQIFARLIGWLLDDEQLVSATRD